MSKSIERVRTAAENAGMTIDIHRFGRSTRTAEDAARECGCDVAQIVKSLIFEGRNTGRLILFMLSGSNRLDENKAEIAAGEPVKRANPDKVREITGFAIGGVAPIGSLKSLQVFADETLLTYPTVWAAAGAHDAVFKAGPNALIKAAGAVVADLAS
jgi:prolyl-tRNA editing enzyme YbaK/EbsC (Cys-tRNA(Pro) deacylase)